MESLKADLEAKKAMLKATRSSSRSFIVQKEVENERVRKYYEEQSQRTNAKIPRSELESSTTDSKKNPEKPADPGCGLEENRENNSEKNMGEELKDISKKETKEKPESLERSEGEKRFLDNDKFFKDLMTKFDLSNSPLELKANGINLYFDIRLLLDEWEQIEVKPERCDSQNKSKDASHETEPVGFEKRARSSSEKFKDKIELQPVVRDHKFLVQIYIQTTLYLLPFFSLLREDRVPQDVLDHLMEIVEQLQTRNYVKANDAYIRLSIGNAPWPIGVTMVCIHERSARERIHSNQVAHVLNDERQRKWIQSIKRLISFCQRVHPPEIITHALG